MTINKIAAAFGHREPYNESGADSKYIFGHVFHFDITIPSGFDVGDEIDFTSGAVLSTDLTWDDVLSDSDNPQVLFQMDGIRLILGAGSAGLTDAQIWDILTGLYLEWEVNRQTFREPLFDAIVHPFGDKTLATAADTVQYEAGNGIVLRTPRRINLQQNGLAIKTTKTLPAVAIQARAQVPGYAVPVEAAAELGGLDDGAKPSTHQAQAASVYLAHLAGMAG